MKLVRRNEFANNFARLVILREFLSLHDLMRTRTPVFWQVFFAKTARASPSSLDEEHRARPSSSLRA